MSIASISYSKITPADALVIVQTVPWHQLNKIEFQYSCLATNTIVPTYAHKSFKRNKELLTCSILQATYCFFGDEAFQDVMRMLAVDNGQTLELNMSYCRIGDKGALTLSTLILANSRICVDLSYANIDRGNGSQQLAMAINHNQQRVKIQYSMYGLGQGNICDKIGTTSFVDIVNNFGERDFGGSAAERAEVPVAVALLLENVRASTPNVLGIPLKSQDDDFQVSPGILFIPPIKCSGFIWKEGARKFLGFSSWKFRYFELKTIERSMISLEYFSTADATPLSRKGTLNLMGYRCSLVQPLYLHLVSPHRTLKLKFTSSHDRARWNQAILAHLEAVHTPQART